MLTDSGKLKNLMLSNNKTMIYIVIITFMTNKKKYRNLLLNQYRTMFKYKEEKEIDLIRHNQKHSSKL